MKKPLKKILIQSSSSITNTLKKLRATGLKCLIVVDKKKKYLGTITDGDIRNEILKNKDFTRKIINICNTNSIFFNKENFNKPKADKIIKDKGIPLIPIINKDFKPIDYYIPFGDFNIKPIDKSKGNRVIIMAGGQGKRLQPFTSILPKPLIPVKGKPVLIHIMNLFKSNGFNNFSISINSKNNVLKSYLNELKKIYDFNYIQENSPLGTAGALKKLKNIKEAFFIVNCDNLFRINPKDLINFHNENNNFLTLVASVKKFTIPYGVCELNKKSGKLIKMDEKPIKFVLANTGFYFCEPKVLEFLPKKKNFGMNDLINILQKKKKKIGVFPIKDTDWQDTGNWFDYMNIIQAKR